MGAKTIAVLVTIAFSVIGVLGDYFLKLAAYVDTKMRAVSQATHTVDTARLAVLAAINIADEYHLLKRRAEGGTSDSSRRATQLLDALDEVLTEKQHAG